MLLLFLMLLFNFNLFFFLSSTTLIGAVQRDAVSNQGCQHLKLCSVATFLSIFHPFQKTGYCNFLCFINTTVCERLKMLWTPNACFFFFFLLNLLLS